MAVGGLQVNVDVLKIKNDYKFTCQWYRDWVMYDDYGELELKLVFQQDSKYRI